MATERGCWSWDKIQLLKHKMLMKQKLQAQNANTLAAYDNKLKHYYYYYCYYYHC
jgi:hypothetical protein